MPNPSFPKTLLLATWQAEEKEYAKVNKAYKAATALHTALKDLKSAADACDNLDCFDLGKASSPKAAQDLAARLDGAGSTAVKKVGTEAAEVIKQAKAWDLANKADKAAKDAIAAIKLILRDADALHTAWQAAQVNMATELAKRGTASSPADKSGSPAAIARLPEYKLVRAKVGAALRAVKNPKPGARPLQFLLSVGQRLAVPYVAATISPSHKALLKPLMGDDDEGLKYPGGELLWERNQYTFVTDKAASGMAKKLQAGLHLLTKSKLKVCVRRPDGAGEELDGDADFQDADAEPITVPDLVARYKSLEEGILAVKALGAVAINEALDKLIARFKDALTGTPLDPADAILDQIDAVIVAATGPGTPAEPTPPEPVATTDRGARPAAPKPVAELSEPQRQALEKVLKDRDTSLKLRDKLKQDLATEASRPDPDLDKLRKLTELEFKRADELDKAMKKATEDGLPVPPSPARVSFDDNDTAGAAEWTLPVCAEAFRRYGWFEFKALRKSGEAVEIAGLKGQTRITDDVMWKLYQYRRRFVDQLISSLHQKYPKPGLLFKSSGSEDIESDLDITVASPGSGDDVKAMRDFNAAIKAKFGRAPGRVFDTNLYARDYRAIKDNLSDDADRGGAVPKDADIAQPEGAMAHMGAIDQDVATLMKQRRFLDADTFTAMWEALVQAIPDEKERRRIQQRFEEGEAAYILTAQEKVNGIVAKVKAARTKVPPQRKAAFETAYKQFEVELRIYQDALEGGHERAMQRQIPLLLDFLEQEFPDETMEATDDQYAQHMTALRERQARLKAVESDEQTHVVDGPDCEAVHKGRSHAEWMKSLPGEKEALKARIKQDQFTNIVFANEAYMSEGAITHIVTGVQARTDDEKRAVLEKITPAELLQSTNEQVADFFKDMKHMQHEEHAAQGAAAKLQVAGEAFVHASKYLSRMLDAAAMLQEKYAGKPEAVKTLTDPPYTLCANAALGPRELQKAVDGWLVKLRKTATVPGDAKALLAVREVQQRFKVSDIAGLQKAITGFTVEFNQRVRMLQDFRDSQDQAEKAFQQYFKPAA